MKLKHDRQQLLSAKAATPKASALGFVMCSSPHMMPGPSAGQLYWLAYQMAVLQVEEAQAHEFDPSWN